MARRFLWIFTLSMSIAAALGGCGADQPDPTASMSSKDRLTGAAEKLAADPNASPTARSIANSALERTKQNDALDDFAKGR
jgi:hypothetical protein